MDTEEQSLFNRVAYGMLTGHGCRIDSSVRRSKRATELLRELQRIECDVAPAQWDHELQRIATAYNLTLPE